LKGLDLCSALALLLSPHGLDCDYRYGCLCVTTAEDAKDWHDPTGVADIQPPKGSWLARAWNEPVEFQEIESPLADVIKRMVRGLAIEIDTTQIEPTADQPEAYLVTANFNRHPFRHTLGYALYRTGCGCRLEGDRLIILPPD